MTTRTITKIIFFVCVVAALLAGPVLSISGFCFAQRRFMSNDEYFDAAIRQIMSQELQAIITRGPEGVGYKYVHPIPYRDVSDFRAANPNCCKVMTINSGLQDRVISFWDVLQGRAARSVYLTYTINYIGADGQRQTAQLETQLVMGNCGQVY